MTFVIAGLVAVMVARLSERLEAAEALREQEREARVRILAAADEERRQVARDLHDGAQQRLVHTILTLTLASQALRKGDDSAPELVDEGLRHAEEAMRELRDLVRGVLPSVLTIGGLRAAVESLASRVSIPISFDVCADRLAPAVEATAYFVTAEALTNLEKHARAESAQVSASLEGDMLRVEVRDDGVGGAHLQASSGLVGLQDRVESLGGGFELHSPAGEGTVIVATLPAARGRAAPAAYARAATAARPHRHARRTRPPPARDEDAAAPRRTSCLAISRAAHAHLAAHWQHARQRRHHRAHRGRWQARCATGRRRRPGWVARRTGLSRIRRRSTACSKIECSRSRSSTP